MSERSPLVLLPGMMCDKRLWQPVVDCLPGLSVIVPDLSRQASIEEMASSVLKQLNGDFSLAGLSMGGIVAFEILRLAPGRVRRLAVLGTNASAEGRGRRRARVAQLRQLKDHGLKKLFETDLVPAYFGADRPVDPAIEKVILAMAHDLGESVFQRQSLALHRRQDYRQHLPSISCPAMVICGDKDGLCPVAYHREISRLIPGAQLEIISNCGHLSALEQPIRVSRLLERWLSDDGQCNRRILRSTA